MHPKIGQNTNNSTVGKHRRFKIPTISVKKDFVRGSQQLYANRSSTVDGAVVTIVLIARFISPHPATQANIKMHHMYCAFLNCTELRFTRLLESFSNDDRDGSETVAIKRSLHVLKFIANISTRLKYQMQVNIFLWH